MTTTATQKKTQLCEAKRSHGKELRKEAKHFVEELDRYLCGACYRTYLRRRQQGWDAKRINQYLDETPGLVIGRNIPLSPPKVDKETHDALESLIKRKGIESIFTVNVRLLELLAKASRLAEAGDLKGVRAASREFEALVLPSSPSD